MGEDSIEIEGGLGHFAGMMATGAAIDYLTGLNMNEVHEHEIRLNSIMSNGVKDLNGVSIIGPEDPPKEVEFAHFFSMNNSLPTTLHYSLTKWLASWYVRANIASIHGLMIVDTTAH